MEDECLGENVSVSVMELWSNRGESLGWNFGFIAMDWNMGVITSSNWITCVFRLSSWIADFRHVIPYSIDNLSVATRRMDDFV